MGRSFVVVLLLLICAPRAEAASFRVAAPGHWVDRLALPADEPLAVPRPLEQRTLLSDLQINFGVHSVERYARWATRIDDEASLQSASHLTIAFDPSYQSVVLHSVVVVRKGARLNRLCPEKIKQAQREPNLEAQMYDGHQTLVLFLEDLRIGDILDVEYTISGADPTLAGHVSEMLFLGTPMPVERLRARVLVPTGKRFRYVASGPGAEGLRARAKPTPFGDEYAWDRVDVPAYPIETKLPSWYEPLPLVQLTDFESWAAVARWAEALMLRPVAPSAAIVAEARALRERSSSNQAFAQAATRFVQDEIRYVAVETGLSRRKPKAPELVLERRFGDCKDKSLLLASLLRAGGIDSEPALVSTAWRDHLDSLLPSASVFDHAIVHVRAGPVGPSDLWIDPTTALAGGGLERALGSTLGRALVLSGSAESLATIPRASVTGPQASIRDRYQIPEAGSHEPARLDIEREFHGNLADGLRATLRRGTRSEMAKSYLQLYARQFPEISPAGEVEVLDERDRDRLLITVHFTIRDPWKRSETHKR